MSHVYVRKMGQISNRQKRIERGKKPLTAIHTVCYSILMQGNVAAAAAAAALYNVQRQILGPLGLLNIIFNCPKKGLLSFVLFLVHESHPTYLQTPSNPQYAPALSVHAGIGLNTTGALAVCTTAPCTKSNPSIFAPAPSNDHRLSATQFVP